MLDFLILFKDQILAFMLYMTPIVSISFMSLGMVYAMGRLLEIVHSNRSKNTFALIFIVIFSIVTVHNSFKDWTPELIMSVVELVTISSIFYVIVCWKFYTRFDTLLDKWIGSGSEEKTKNKRKK